MPAFLVALAGVLANVLSYTAGRVLVALGISVVTFAGIATVLAGLRAQFETSWGAMPAAVIQIMGLMRVDQAALIIFSSLAARLALQAVEGTISRVVMRGPGA